MADVEVRIDMRNLERFKRAHADGLLEVVKRVRQRYMDNTRDVTGRRDAGADARAYYNNSEIGAEPAENGAGASYPLVGGAEAYVGNNVFYARFQEQGTVKMAARPALAPAIAGLQGEDVRIIRDEVARRIR